MCVCVRERDESQTVFREQRGAGQKQGGKNGNLALELGHGEQLAYCLAVLDFRQTVHGHHHQYRKRVPLHKRTVSHFLQPIPTRLTKELPPATTEWQTRGPLSQT